MSNRDEQIKKAVARGMNKSAQGAAVAGGPINASPNTQGDTGTAQPQGGQSGGDKGMLEQMGDFVGDTVSMPSMGDIGDFWGSAASAEEGPAGGVADEMNQEEKEFFNNAK